MRAFIIIAAAALFVGGVWFALLFQGARGQETTLIGTASEEVGVEMEVEEEREVEE